MSQYTQFQDWLNHCPVEITNYQDFTDSFTVTFSVPLEDDHEDSDSTVTTYGLKEGESLSFPVHDPTK